MILFLLMFMFCSRDILNTGENISSQVSFVSFFYLLLSTVLVAH